MDGTPYQPAPPVWRTSPERILLWALNGAMHRIERELPERKDIARWETKLHKAIGDAVKTFRWESLWTAKHIRKDKHQTSGIPDDVMQAWAALPELIADELWRDAGETRTSALDLPFDDAALRAGLDDAVSMVKSIPETLHDRLREIMEQAYEDKTGPQGFARAIRSEFADVAKWKAEQIAQTEWNRAASTATLESYKSQGVASKIWYSLGDDRVCDECENNAAEGEVPIGQQFSSGDQAPPAHPGCRCDIAGL